MLSCRVVPSAGQAPGTVLAVKPRTVACAEGAVELLRVVPEGSKPMDAAAPLRPVCGVQSRGGAVMGASPEQRQCPHLIRQGAGRLLQPDPGRRLRRQKLDGRDKAFASAIFYTVLEHRGTLDYILEQFLPKGLARLDPPVREILRSALAQARYMRVPVSAAVNGAVKLTRSFQKSSASGL